MTTPKRLKRLIVSASLAGLGIVAAGLLYLLYLFDWNDARAPLSKAASERAGRTIAIRGELSVAWGWPVSRIRAAGLEVDNIASGSAPRMLEIDEIDAAIDIRRLLTGNLVFTDVELVKPRLLLEKLAHGANWSFVDNPAGAVATAVVPENRREFPTIERLSIADGRITYRDAKKKTALSARATTVRGAADEQREEIRFTGEGTLQNQPFGFNLVGGSVLQLRESAAPYPVTLAIKAGRTHAKLVGTVTDPIEIKGEMKGLDVALEVSGDNAADLFPLTGIALLPTPPYAVAGRLRYDNRVWTFQNFAGRLGGSDLAGDLRWDQRPRRPRLTASFTSRKLVLADLGGFIGVLPDKTPVDAGRVLPDVSLDISRLAAMDADVEFSGMQIVSTKLPLDDFRVHFALDDRVLKIAPVTFGSGSGDIVLRTRIDGRARPVRITGNLEVRRVPIATLFEKVSTIIGERNMAAGTIGGTAAFAGTGKSLRDMLATSNGHLGIGMEGGQLSHLVVELIGLDVAESAGYLLAGDQPVPIRCVIGDFQVVDGLMTPNSLVIDTDDTVVTGNGAVDLGDESLDLELKPAPKDFSPFALRAPIEVGGTFKNPEFKIKPAGLVGRGALATVLGVLFPPAAVLAFVEPGLGKDSACAGMVVDMVNRSQNPTKTDRLVPQN